MEEIAKDISEDQIAEWFEEDIAELEHMLGRHAQFEEYCRKEGLDGPEEEKRAA